MSTIGDKGHQGISSILPSSLIPGTFPFVLLKEGFVFSPLPLYRPKSPFNERKMCLFTLFCIQVNDVPTISSLSKHILNSLYLRPVISSPPHFLSSPLLFFPPFFLFFFFSFFFYLFFFIFFFVPLKNISKRPTRSTMENLWKELYCYRTQYYRLLDCVIV